MDRKINFSICLIARNEAKTLPRLLSSLKEFREKGGKIYLADTGSTDDTVHIARAYGCEVFECGDQFKITIDETTADLINQNFIINGDLPVIKTGDKLFDFASARNWIAEKSETKMIAMPDCDEQFTNFDLDKICKHIDNGIEQFEYMFTFSFDEYGNPGVEFLHSKFYDKTKLKWKGLTHEILCTK